MVEHTQFQKTATDGLTRNVTGNFCSAKSTIVKFCIFGESSAMTNKEYILSALRTNKTKLSKLGIRSVGLFGSYIRNEQSSESDIDLLIDFEPEKENFDNYMAVYDLFESIFKSQKIEVVTKNGLSPYIGPKILNEVQYV